MRTQGWTLTSFSAPALVLARSRTVAAPPSSLSSLVPRSCCPSVPAKARGNSPVPPSRAAEAFGGLAPVPPFPLPLGQGQAEHKGCKQGARGDTGTRDTLWGPGWPGPSPELWGNRGSQSLGDQAVPSEWGGRGRGPRAGCPVPRCPLVSPGVPAGAGRVDKAMPQQLKVVGGCRYRVWQRGRAGGA